VTRIVARICSSNGQPVCGSRNSFPRVTRSTNCQVSSTTNKNPRTNHKERKELIWPFPCNNTKAFTKQTNKQTLVEQTNQLQWKPRKEIFWKVGKGSCEHIKVLTSPCEETDCHKTTKDLRGGRGETFATQYRGHQDRNPNSRLCFWVNQPVQQAGWMIVCGQETLFHWISCPLANHS